jgi:hypothetical protein
VSTFANTIENQTIRNHMALDFELGANDVDNTRMLKIEKIGSFVKYTKRKSVYHVEISCFIGYVCFGNERRLSLNNNHAANYINAELRKKFLSIVAILKLLTQFITLPRRYITSLLLSIISLGNHVMLFW